MLSMLWSMEVSHGVSEYSRSTGVSLGVLEYHLEYWSIIWSTGVLSSRSVDIFLTFAISMIKNKVLKLLFKLSFLHAYTQYFW